ncbi:MAG: hypothetical protein AUK34_12120 [Ignavibacteria bacterium CG2_30_36_16]|nr:hypothetical protein [Ignavibacteria bacterium]OIP55962.1 MAG: hypothetical protein AUK34_12120 [Ignavibacteria bacterium CG2_30_36_16]PJA99703.1 MAG: hypothetical protein CO127_09995 [Ignavibacteria bacterium CG_4_9_14_3_um_filter_36_18]
MKYLLVFLISAINLIAQPKMYINNSLEQVKSSIYPNFDIHIAAGFSAGGRIGMRLILSKNISTEFSYGKDLRNFITLSDEQNRFTFGFNYSMGENGFVLSLLTTYVDQPNSVYEAIYISPMFGFLPLQIYGFHFFFRGGFTIEIIKAYPTANWKYEDFGPNLDAGIIWVF